MHEEPKSDPGEPQPHGDELEEMVEAEPEETDGA